MSRNATPISPEAQAIISAAVLQANSSFSYYHEGILGLEDVVADICFAFDEACEQLIAIRGEAYLLQLTGPWADMLFTSIGLDGKLPSAAPALANFHWRHGRALMGEQDYLAAETQFTKALDRYEAVVAGNGAAPRIHFLRRLYELRGLCHANLQQFAAAQADFAQQLALADDPTDKASILRMVAAAEWQLGERKSAIARLEQALVHVDADPQPHMALRAHIEQGLAQMRAEAMNAEG